MSAADVAGTVLCAAPGHGSRPHKERPDCLYPHYVHPHGSPCPSMTAVETLDPREGVTRKG